MNTQTGIHLRAPRLLTAARGGVRKLAEATGYDQSTVQQILSAGAIKPHKTGYWCGKSPDPKFVEKQAVMTGLYLSPRKNAVVLCVAEKLQIQVVDRIRPVLPMQRNATLAPNHAATMLAEFGVSRYGWECPDHLPDGFSGHWHA